MEACLTDWAKLSLLCPDQGEPQSGKHSKMSVRADGLLHVHSRGPATSCSGAHLASENVHSFRSPEHFSEEKNQLSIQVCVLPPALG